MYYNSGSGNYCAYNNIKIKKIPSPFISLSPIQIRLLNRALKGTYTTEQLLHILKDIKICRCRKTGFHAGI